jgi:hypothetical protein
MHGLKLATASAACCVLLAACASGSDSGAAARPTDVRVYRPSDFPDRDYEVLAELEEIEPVGAPRVDPDPAHRSEDDRVADRRRQDAEHRAIARMRTRAARLEADALVVTECGRLIDSRDPSTRYQETMHCTGFAVRFKVLGPDGLPH